MTPLSSVPDRILGLFELDQNGRILFAYVETCRSPTLFENGTDFFAERAHFLNSRELKECFELFQKKQRQVQSFPFIWQYDDGPIEVIVILAQLDRNGQTPSILMHVRLPKNSHPAAAKSRPLRR